MNDVKNASGDKIEIGFAKTPAGNLKITGNESGILSVTFTDEIFTDEEIPFCLRDCFTQLSEYFEGKRKDFDLKLNPRGTEFQEKVWARLLKLPFGKTISYGKIADILGDKNLVRAVGLANGKNPIAIIIPCHRVIGANGSLVGYAGGLARKKWLLQHESASRQTDLF